MVRLTNQTKNDYLFEPEKDTIKRLGPNIPGRDPDEDDDAPPVIEISDKHFQELKKKSGFQSLIEADSPGEMPDIQVQEDV